MKRNPTRTTLKTRRPHLAAASRGTGRRTSLRQVPRFSSTEREAGTQSEVNGFLIPPMPVAWTPEVVRVLFPIPLALGRKVTFVRALPEPVLVLMHAGERTFPSTARGWVDLWTTIGQTTKPEAVKMAVLQVKNAMRWAEATPFRDALAGLEAEAKARLVLDGLVFLGGHGYGAVLRPGTVVDLRMTADAVVLSDVGDGSRAHTFPVTELRELEAIDPATVMNDGLDNPSGNASPGRLQDQATAVWMTESAGKSSIMALVRIVTEKSELLLRSMTAAPDAAHIALSPLRRRLTRHAIVPTTPGPDAGQPSAHVASRRAERDAIGPDSQRAGRRDVQDASRRAGRQVASRRDAQDASRPAGRQAADEAQSSRREPPASASPGSEPARDLPTADDADADFVSRLERLARLRDAGALSEYEFLVAKTKLLS
jgi:hypothetical protein